MRVIAPCRPLEALLLHTVMYTVAKMQVAGLGTRTRVQHASVGWSLEAHAMVGDSARGTTTPTPVGDTHRALHEVAAERIRTAILNGTLFPGERLVEDRLAQELNVSRHPVREALRTLQLEGFVDIEPRRGATVSRVSTEEASELFEVLSALDGLAARSAATSPETGEIAEIDAVLASATTILEGSTSLSPTDLADLADLNRRFHILVTQAGRNRQLLDTITPLRERIQWIQAAVNRRRPELSWSEHRSIRDAIVRGDADNAESLARFHIEAARITYLAQRSSAGDGRL
ncbi:MAG: GntR family transcriptional regulator [Armatimonadetes bacterium]|nr:MAG: GntR family transcriptional regulator [Armatimonadota bacterium]